MTIVAIDLGTAHTRIAVWQNGTVKVLKNDKGNRTTPSCVAFTATERLIGDAAKNQMAMNVHNTVYDLKRLMGRSTDHQVISDMSKWPFRVQQSVDDLYPNIEIDVFKSRRTFKAEELMAMILESAKDTVEKIVGKFVTEAVITVPSFFGSVQRQAIRDAAHIAGFNVRRLLNETTAAGLAYGMEYKVKGKQTALFYHLGAGAFDVAVMEITNGRQFNVLGVEGNSCLGGIDFDDRLVQYFASEFERQNHITIRNNPRAMRRLRTACESLKKILSTNSEAVIEVDSLSGDFDLNSKITRDHFYSITSDLFEVTFNAVAKLLEKLKLDGSQIDEVFLIGGSTRIPKVTMWHEEYFGAAKMNYTMNAEEIVVTGAAVQAGALEAHSIIVKDIPAIPLYLRQFVPHKKPQKLFDHLDTKVSCQYETNGDNVTEASLTICEMMAGSHFCESFKVVNIPEAPAGDIKLNFNFRLDANGIFYFPKAAILSKSLGHTNLCVHKQLDRMDADAIEKAKVKAHEFRQIDRDIRQKKAARVKFENEILSIEQDLVKSGLASTPKRAIQARCCDEMQWLAQHPLEEVSVFENRIRDLKALNGQVRAREALIAYINCLEVEFLNMTGAKVKTKLKVLAKAREWLDINENSCQDVLETKILGLKSWAADTEKTFREDAIENYKAELKSFKDKFKQLETDYGPKAVAELQTLFAGEMVWLSEKGALERASVIKKRFKAFTHLKDEVLAKHQKAVVTELEKICRTWLDQTSEGAIIRGLSQKKVTFLKSLFEDDLNWLTGNKKNAKFAEVKKRIDGLDAQVKSVIRKKSSMLEMLKLWYAKTFTWKKV